jgi:hypothetical protein
MRQILCSFMLVLFTTSCARTQTLKLRPVKPSTATPPASDRTKSPATIPLTIVAGTPLKVILDREVRIQKIGQSVHGKTTEPIYSFDKLLVPARSEVFGKIAEIDAVTKKTRTLSAMNADFSPSRKVQIEVDEVLMPDGRHLPIHALVSPGFNGVLQFVPANEAKQGKVAEGKSMAKVKLRRCVKTLTCSLPHSRSRFRRLTRSIAWNDLLWSSLLIVRNTLIRELASTPPYRSR